MDLGNAAETIYRSVPQGTMLPIKGRFGFPRMFLGFRLNGNMRIQNLSVSVPLMRWAVLMPPRSLASAFVDKMSAGSYLA